jgi:hypothetical protein
MACDRLSGRPRSEPAGGLKCAPIRVIKNTNTRACGMGLTPGSEAVVREDVPSPFCGHRRPLSGLGRFLCGRVEPRCAGPGAAQVLG